MRVTLSRREPGGHLSILRSHKKPRDFACLNINAGPRDSMTGGRATSVLWDPDAHSKDRRELHAVREEEEEEEKEEAAKRTALVR
mmetsp:Transcript_25346/g.83848  ORF Transcript_25346/g.83848 Transcript_25346/m.83848 type:complete len:85 (+) Transcript_25346:4651-4905(+)